MEYSSEELAKLSKVSVRTLHYYDEINLLTPMARMENGKRLYGTKELLLLHEILLFKELGFSLKETDELLPCKNKIKADTLLTKKKSLQKEIKRLKEVLQTIDKTVAHYEGNRLTLDEACDHFEHFQKEVKKQEELSQELYGNDIVEESKQKVLEMSKEDLQSYSERSMQLMNQLVDAINKDLSPDSPEVQKLMQLSLDITSEMTPMNKELYLKSIEALEINSPANGWLEKMHPKLQSFLKEAMTIFAKQL